MHGAARLIVPTLLAALLGAGCSATGDEPRGSGDGGSGDSGSGGTQASAATFEPLLTDAELEELTDDYARRWSRAQARQGEVAEPVEVWAEALDGPMLAGRELEARGLAAVGQQADVAGLELDPLVLYGGDLEASPQWVMVGSRFERQSKGSEPGHIVTVLVRSGPDDPWRGFAEAGVGSSSSDLPFPLEDADTTATEQALEQAEGVIGDLVTFWETGRSPDSVTVQPYLREIVEETEQLSAEEVDEVSVDASEWDSTSSRVVMIGGGALLVSTLRVDVTLHARPGRVLYWKEPFATVFGGERREELVTTIQVTSLVRLPEGGGTATYLDHSDDPVATAAKPNV